MQHSVFHINDKNADKISFNSFYKYGTNEDDIESMKRFLAKAMMFELTNRQRECIIRYFFEHKKMCDIASELGLAPSTVSRHICAAKSKLKNVSRYY